MRPENFGLFLEDITEYKQLLKGLKSKNRKCILQSVSESIPFTLAKLSIDLQRPMLILTPKLTFCIDVHAKTPFWALG